MVEVARYYKVISERKLSGTAGPFTPKPGWLKRWSVEALQLLYRSPQSILTIYIGGVIFTYLYSVAFQLWLATGIQEPLSLSFSTLVLIPFGALILCYATNFLMQADRDAALEMPDLRRRAKPVINIALAIGLAVATLLLPLNLALTFSAESSEFAEVVNKIFNDPERLFVRGFGRLMSCFLGVVVVHVFAIPAAMGLGLGVKGILVFDRRLRAVSFGFWMSITGLFILAITLMQHAPVIIMPALFTFLLAFNYVAGREVVGGISGNGKAKQATDKAPGRAMPDTR